MHGLPNRVAHYPIRPLAECISSAILSIGGVMLRLKGTLHRYRPSRGVSFATYTGLMQCTNAHTLQLSCWIDPRSPPLQGEVSQESSITSPWLTNYRLDATSLSIRASFAEGRGPPGYTRTPLVPLQHVSFGERRTQHHSFRIWFKLSSSKGL